MSEGKVTVILLVVLFILWCWADSSEQKSVYNELLEEYTVIEEESDGDLIVYDKDTYIVYKAKFVDGNRERDRYDIDSYFADNGKPFKYNQNTKKIEMITEE